MSLGKETLDMEENSQQSDSSSDSGRLQMDISHEDGTEENEDNRKIKKECYDRETPESIASDDHINDATDPATTQLWQALAQTTVNGGGTEATQLLRRMINCRSLGIPLPMMKDQPMSLTKVGFFFFCTYEFYLILTIILRASNHCKKNYKNHPVEENNLALAVLH